MINNKNYNLNFKLATVQSVRNLSDTNNFLEYTSDSRCINTIFRPITNNVYQPIANNVCQPIANNICLNQCQRGQRGFQGFQGFQGFNGFQGFQGFQGSQGESSLAIGSIYSYKSANDQQYVNIGEPVLFNNIGPSRGIQEGTIKITKKGNYIVNYSVIVQTSLNVFFAIFKNNQLIENSMIGLQATYFSSFQLLVFNFQNINVLPIQDSITSYILQINKFVNSILGNIPAELSNFLENLQIAGNLLSDNLIIISNSLDSLGQLIFQSTCITSEQLFSQILALFLALINFENNIIDISANLDSISNYFISDIILSELNTPVYITFSNTNITKQYNSLYTAFINTLSSFNQFQFSYAFPNTQQINGSIFINLDVNDIITLNNFSCDEILLPYLIGSTNDSISTNSYLEIISLF